MTEMNGHHHKVEIILLAMIKVAGQRTNFGIYIYLHIEKD